MIFIAELKSAYTTTELFIVEDTFLGRKKVLPDRNLSIKYLFQTRIWLSNLITKSKSGSQK